ncbi:ABC transporter substrate-binding protein [Cucumibacter marinus]|uniref:ABC transporter substrate-binding protein n=1 Tax=Cucumibacter marinus TaxID=1121252 RepID=UPI00040989E2|nr:ABC transporter substrate-binding protein [Cucumibacter marinus]
MRYQSKGRIAPVLVTSLGLVMAIGGAASAEVAPPAGIDEAGKIVFCTELAYPPWEMLNPQTQEPEGFDIDIAAALANAMDVEAEHKNISFDGLIPALQAGQCDAIISGLANKPERREVVDFVDYAVAGNALIVRADDDASFETLEDLSGYKVSVAVGSALEAELNTANEAIVAAGNEPMEIIALQSGTDAFQQLTAGLADVYFGSTDQAGYFNAQRPGLLKLASPQLFSLTIGVATLKSAGDLHDAIAAAFADIRDNGGYGDILATWGFEALAIE